MSETCIDCGEPDPGSPNGRCRECDIEHTLASMACKHCGITQWNERLCGPNKHLKSCPSFRLMTALDVLRRVKEIGTDPEEAHADEDRIHQDVLVAIAAAECDDPRAVAAAALETRKLTFARWYA